MGFDIFCDKLKGRTYLELLDRIITSRKLLSLRYIIKRLLNVYRKKSALVHMAEMHSHLFVYSIYLHYFDRVNTFSYTAILPCDPLVTKYTYMPVKDIKQTHTGQQYNQETIK